MNNENFKEIREAKIAGAIGVFKRSDFKPASEASEFKVIKKAMSHENKIAMYRDRVMSLVSGKIEEALFDKLDRNSNILFNTYADNTEIAMYSDFVKYLEFCNSVGQSALPFRDFNVDLYLSNMMAKGNKRSAIDRHIASLVKWADILEIDDPRRSFKVKARINEIRKKVKKNKRQAEGLRIEHLMKALEMFNPEVPRDCQDITLLFVGFETLCRQSELVSFDWPEFKLQSDGTGILELCFSKTDQDGDGAKLFLSKNTSNLLLGWQLVSNSKGVASPIFRGIYSNGCMGGRLSTRGVQRCFKRIATRLNLEPSVFSGHSTRVGAAQEMVERNIDSAKIMLSGRWVTMHMLTQYSKNIRATRSGIADLTTQLGWNSDKSFSV
jgi:integrase/recombinase XerD